MASESVPRVFSVLDGDAEELQRVSFAAGSGSGSGTGTGSGTGGGSGSGGGSGGASGAELAARVDASFLGGDETLATPFGTRRPIVLSAAVAVAVAFLAFGFLAFWLFGLLL
jgi:hypothetical protein